MGLLESETLYIVILSSDTFLSLRIMPSRAHIMNRNAILSNERQESQRNHRYAGEYLLICQFCTSDTKIDIK